MPCGDPTLLRKGCEKDGALADFGWRIASSAAIQAEQITRLQPLKATWKSGASAPRNRPMKSIWALAPVDPSMAIHNPPHLGLPKEKKGPTSLRAET
jgi:hypothetical protein